MTTMTRQMAYLDSVETPAGLIHFAVNESGALVRASFDEGKYKTSITDDLLADGWAISVDPDQSAAARHELVEYTEGTRTTFSIAVAPTGTDWQMAVWAALQAIPFGETRTYGQIATRLGHPGAAQAVGRANGMNKIPLVIPCHRVIGANGAMTGFAGGIHLKTRLLAHEQRVSGKPVTIGSQAALL